MNEIKEYTNKIFENIKHIDETGNEYWLARELMEVLEYKEWRKFDKVIRKTIDACSGSSYCVTDHFVLKDKMINIAKGAQRRIQDYKLSRIANSVHYEVGKEVRDSIKRLGGTMPEDLPTPEKKV